MPSHPRPALRALLLACALAAATRAETPPFLDLETGERPLAEGVQVQPWAPRCAPGGPRVVAGCGLPLALAWTLPPATACARLSYREGNTVVRLDVTGQEGIVLRPGQDISGCLLEALRPLPGRRGVWLSHLQELQAGVRGLAQQCPCAQETSQRPFASHRVSYAQNLAHKQPHAMGRGHRWMLPC